MRITDIDTNRGQEQYGEKGLLPDSEYNIRCPLFPGPEYKLNYYTTSCDIRLEVGSCKNKDCERYLAKNPVKVVPEPIPEGHRCCVVCDKIKKISCRDMCKACENKCRKDGTIYNYPTQSGRRMKRK